MQVYCYYTSSSSVRKKKKGYKIAGILVVQRSLIAHKGF